MSYTDQDVEEVINAYFMAYNTSKNARGQTADASTVHRKAHEQGVRAARAALEAMEREPLEDVLDDIEYVSRTQEGWEVGISVRVPDETEPKGYKWRMRYRVGDRIGEAIRAAVAAAKGEKA